KAGESGNGSKAGNGSEGLIGGGDGGVWAVDTTTGLARWVNTTTGNVVNSAPSLSRNGQTLYIGTVTSNITNRTNKPKTERVEGSGTWTLHALDTVTGQSRASYTIPDPFATDAGDFRGSAWVWPNATTPANMDVYATAGDRVYAFTDTGAAGTLPIKAGWPAGGYASVVGAGTPLYLPATNSVYTGGNNGNLYRINAANGTIASSFYLNTTGAVSDLTYDVTRNAFYLTVDNMLKSVVRDW
ncbi:MAG TPA: PQQ-binding-like beta-propeller repeat protein, partial [Chloroflexia bacterium]|nr:PQQ-binding-like beta-propeller repeat protein [Chloroflexia bacterium]